MSETNSISTPPDWQKARKIAALIRIQALDIGSDNPADSSRFEAIWDLCADLINLADKNIAASVAEGGNDGD